MNIMKGNNGVAKIINRNQKNYANLSPQEKNELMLLVHTYVEGYVTGFLDAYNMDMESKKEDLVADAYVASIEILHSLKDNQSKSFTSIIGSHIKRSLSLHLDEILDINLERCPDRQAINWEEDVLTSLVLVEKVSSLTQPQKLVLGNMYDLTGKGALTIQQVAEDLAMQIEEVQRLHDEAINTLAIGLVEKGEKRYKDFKPKTDHWEPIPMPFYKIETRDRLVLRLYNKALETEFLVKDKIHSVKEYYEWFVHNYPRLDRLVFEFLEVMILFEKDEVRVYGGANQVIARKNFKKVEELESFLRTCLK